MFVLSIAILYLRPNSAFAVASIFGILAAALSAVQYLPQIYTTFSLQRVGSLSIPMMCIQTPGSYVWAGSLAARYGVDGWSTWGVYLVTGTLQGCLLVMAITFELRDRRKGVVSGAENGSTEDLGAREGPIEIVDNEANEDEDDQGEETPLLSNAR